MSVLIGLTATLAPTIGPTLGGWLTEQYLLALAVPDQRAGRPGGRRRGVDLARHRQAGLVAAPQLRPARAAADGGVPRRAGIRAGGRRPLGLVRRTRRSPGPASLSTVAGVLFFWRMLTQARPAGGTARLHQCQFRVRLAVQLRARHRAVWLGVPACRCFSARVRGYDSLQIGETMFVTGVAMFLSAPIAGQLARRGRSAVMLAIGLVMFGGGLWWMAHLTVELRVLGAVLAAGAARRLDDVHHAAGQPDCAWASAAGSGEERLGALQSDAQPGRRGRAGADQHAWPPRGWPCTAASGRSR